jgi:hypothetical protein
LFISQSFHSPNLSCFDLLELVRSTLQGRRTGLPGPWTISLERIKLGCVILVGRAFALQLKGVASDVSVCLAVLVPINHEWPPKLSNSSQQCCLLGARVSSRLNQSFARSDTFVCNRFQSFCGFLWPPQGTLCRTAHPRSAQRRWKSRMNRVDIDRVHCFAWFCVRATILVPPFGNGVGTHVTVRE